MHVALVVLLAVVTVILIVIAQVYRSLPAIEFKRRARQRDSVAKSLYSVAVYGVSAQALLWFLGGLSAASYFILVSNNAPIWLSLTSSLALIWIGFVWIPRSNITPLGQKLAVILAPTVAWILSQVNPITKQASRLKHRGANHTGIYEKTDLAELLERQEAQVDNRIQAVEIDMVKHVLHFNEKAVSDIVIPAKKIVSVSADDLLGPIVLDELHKSGYSYFPVYKKTEADIVGIFNLSSITKTPQEGIKISALMHDGVTSVNEESNLSEALRMIIKTGKHILVVVNNFDEYVGIITAKDVLSELVGHLITDEIADYEDKTEDVQPEDGGVEIAQPTNSEATELLK
jgi:CBS domain containing-hemolysin-like protein